MNILGAYKEIEFKKSFKKISKILIRTNTKHSFSQKYWLDVYTPSHTTYIMAVVNSLLNTC